MPATKRLSNAFAPALSLGLTLCLSSAAWADDYLWLEEVKSPEALAWVEEQNQRAMPSTRAGTTGYDTMESFARARGNALEQVNSVCHSPAA